MNPTPRYPVGTQYNSPGKHPRLCTVTDYLVTRNLAGQIVKTRYVSTHNFLGQTVTDHDVAESTIAMHIIYKDAKPLIGIHASQIPGIKQRGLQRDGQGRTTSVAYETPDGFIVSACLAPADDIYEAASVGTPHAATILSQHPIK